MTKRLAAIGEDVAALDAILITHEHTDHTCGLVALSKAAEKPIPVYLTYGTAPFIDWGEMYARTGEIPGGKKLFHR